MTLHWIDLTVLIGYLSLVAGMGYYFSKKNISTEEYFVGGRSFSGWVVGLSLVGTSISSVTFLSYPADAYKTTWIRFITTWSMPLGVLIAAYYFLPFFRRNNVTSAYEYLEHRFGPSVRVYGGITFIFAQLVRVSIILYLVSLLLHEITGFSIVTNILISGVFVAFYTIMGGINAVIWTDVIQTIILVLGGLLTLGVIINHLPGGLGQIFSVAISDGKLSLAEMTSSGFRSIDWNFSITRKTGTMLFLVGLTSWLTEYSANQNTVQRYAAAKSTYEARKAMLVCVLSSLPIWAFYMFIGTSLYVFFQVFPTIEATEMLNGVRKAEQIFPYFILNFLPPGFTGLVIAAALAAAMSSLDSSINAISTVGVVDIYRRHIKKAEKDKHYLQIAWLIAGGAALFMVCGALILNASETKTLQDTATILYSITGGGLLGLYLLGFFTKKGNAKSVWIGLIVTSLFTIWTILSKRGLVPEWLHTPFDLYYTGLIGNIIMFAVSFTAAVLLVDQRKNLKNLTIWNQ
ncbi:MAG: sodium/solute symporter [Candidatus Marinimicrobia bacterium]|jgi:SSS family solute:Na+ symporter|nr:sodium/solute symporter [Candidatus Neomarinimicrobiota bacterium]MCP4931840.1 sodium/solute symporter [Candidatus Neomarinimicrobiota bacterium]MDP6032644.1 sodium/solute symporter [Candidatus Neomarinimicrobiota bacterium]HCI15731.1 sodium:solute symporter [Candidatus Neomarinimicrobiota bacterium]|tara:strand:- start:4649 stop:6199 length:1551 start_codon:yes stop_codon:yes gene_type:complete